MKVVNVDELKKKFVIIALQIRKTPIMERKYTDVPCCVFFIFLVLSFVGMGIYVLVEYFNIRNSPTPYPPDPYLATDIKPYPRNIIASQLYVEKHWLIFLISVITSIALSYLYVLYLLTFPKLMVCLMLFLGLLSHILIIVLSFTVFRSIVVGGIASFTLFCYVILLCFFGKKFKVGIVIIQIAARILVKNKFILWIPIIKLVLCIVIGLFYAYSFSAAFAVIDYKSRTQQGTGLEIAIITIFVFFWVIFIFTAYYAMTYMVGAVCGQWYYKQENLSKSQMIKRTYAWMLKSFGSLVCTACLLFLLKLVVFLLKVGEHIWKVKVRNPRHLAVKYLLMCVFCIFIFLFKHIEGFVKYLNHYCVIMMSLTGESYIQSAKATVGLLHTQIAMLAVVNLMSRMLLTWGSMVAIGVPFIIACCSLFGTVKQYELLSVLGLISTVNGMISTLIYSIIVQTVSAVFVYYSIDQRLLEYGLLTNSRFYEQAKITLPQILEQSLQTSSSNQPAKSASLQQDESNLVGSQKSKNIKQANLNRELLIQQLKQLLISQSNNSNTSNRQVQVQDNVEDTQQTQNEQYLINNGQQTKQMDIQLSEYTQHIQKQPQSTNEQTNQDRPNPGQNNS